MQGGKEDILEYAPDRLAADLTAMGEKPFRARQVLAWVYQKGAADFAAMSDLPAGLREKLAARFGIGLGAVDRTAESSDGRTVKLLLRFPDGHAVETVSMREGERHTACVSSQVGCAMGCAFCATGGMGFQRNLTSGEILQQALEIQRRVAPVNRVVFMGMGEPLLNLDAVLAAAAGFTGAAQFNLGARRITLSTCGIAPGIRQLAERGVPVRLALSLNSPFQDQREKLMPIARTHRLEDVLAACADYVARTGRRLWIEYVLLPGVNTSPEAARETARIAFRLRAKVNLIEYNPVPGAAFASPRKEVTLMFREILEGHGVPVTVRFRRGRAIAAGCGQLAAQTARA